ISSFGDELRRRRVLAEMTLAALAAKTGYSKGHLSKIESRRRRPTPALARRCDAALRAAGALVALGTAPARPQPAPDAPAPPLHPAWRVRRGPGGTGECAAGLAGEAARLRFRAGRGDPPAPAAVLYPIIRMGRSRA